MQKLRAVTVAIAATFVVSASARAQEVRNFDNSWFWGVKTGINTFSAPGQGATTAADLGVDWLITRVKGGLYVSANQSIFQKDLQISDGASKTGERTVRVNDMRRITVAGMAFPKHFGGMTPYAGIGYTIAVLGSARVFVDSTNTFPSNAFLDRMDALRSRGAVMGMAGLQVQTKRVAVFGQETLIPSNTDFMFTSVLSFFEFGVRYNFGTSIDRQ